MSAIITKTPKYFTRSGQACQICLTIEGFNKIRNGYQILVRDTGVIFEDVVTPNPDPEGDPIVTKDVLKVVEQINIREVFFANDAIDALFAAVGVAIVLELGYNEQFVKLLGDGLLLSTQTEPLYGTKAADWKMC